jgi:hypothetical protein
MRILLFSCLRSCRLASISPLSHDYSSRLPVHNWLTSKPKPMLRYDWLSIGHRGRVNLRLVFCRKSFHLNVKHLETYDHSGFCFFFNWPLAVIILMEHPLWREYGFVSYEYAWPFVKCTYRTYNMLLKIFPFALYTCPMSIQALQCRSCLYYLSYATTAAYSLERS